MTMILLGKLEHGVMRQASSKALTNALERRISFARLRNASQTKWEVCKPRHSLKKKISQRRSD